MTLYQQLQDIDNKKICGWCFKPGNLNLMGFCSRQCQGFFESSIKNAEEQFDMIFKGV